MNTSRSAIEQTTVEAYTKHFGAAPECIASAPGRVNLIGEHTDYNEGFVLPVAIDFATAVAIGPRADDQLVLYSETVTAESSFSVRHLYPSERRAWPDYVIGVASFLQDRGTPLRGANMCIQGNVPREVGLSSSASLELSAAYALITFNKLDFLPVEIVKICQRAEHEFAGVKCGIMDQFVSCLGKRNHALMLDCRSLAHDLVPIPEGVRLVVCDTTVRRALATSEYNRRREECSTGVRALSAKIPGITALRDVTEAQLQEHATLLDSTVGRRCRHVVTENDRVTRAARALRAGDLSEFGKLMYESHLSLRVDYEVSCPELDMVVDICAEAEGVYGARMTGAGFGGCVVSLVTEDAVDGLIERLKSEYPRVSGKSPSVHICSVEGGATSRRLHLVKQQQS